jgi:hypothetical protein
MGQYAGSRNSLSRRSIVKCTILGSLLPALSGLSAFLPSNARARTIPMYGYRRGWRKVPKRVAEYQYAPNGPEHCAICEHFLPPHHCEIVRGRIVAFGWCHFWEPRHY